MKILLLTIFLSINLIGITYADDAYDAYQNKDFETAFNEWQKLAEQGVVKAQTNLALMYLRGEWVPSDPEKSIYWLRKAAEQGYDEAQYFLGRSYGGWGNQYFENIDEPLKNTYRSIIDVFSNLQID